MGVTEALTLAGLLCSLGGGVFGSFVALNGHLTRIESSLTVLRWRVRRIETEILGEEGEE